MKKRTDCKFMLRFCIAVFLSGIWVLGSHAQDITGSLYGTILDQSGALITNARVTIVLMSRGLTRSVNSNRQGEYVFSQLPVGSYELTVVAKSFETEVLKGIKVDADQSTRRDVTMTLGDVSATVVVESSDVGVDTRSATMGTLIDSTTLQEMPLDNAENVVNLASLLPGVTAVSAPANFTGDHSGPTFSASGSRTNQNLFLFDGVLYNNLYRNTGLNYPPRDALQEVQVLTNNYNAEYGRNAGSIFQVITKSGTNTYHGSVWEQAQNTAFNAANFAQHRVLPLIQNQFGASFGGPILRNKIHFLASYQGYRYANTYTNGSPVYTTATPTSGTPVQFINANTDAQVYGGINLYNPQTNTLFPKNSSGYYVIPHGQFDPAAAAIISTFHLASATGALSTVLKEPQNNDLGLIRGDYSFGKHTVDYRYFVLDSNIVSGTGTVFSYDPQYTSSSNMLSSATDTMILSSSLINVAHAGYKRFVSYIYPNDSRSLASFGANFPMAGPPTLPEILVSSEFTLSSANNIYNKFINQNAEINDSLTWVHGTHEIKGGATYLHFQFLERSWNQNQGVFSFTGQRTTQNGTGTPQAGNSFADFLLGVPTTLVASSPELENSAIQNEIFAYLQDQWRILPSLTLSLGIRYELPFPWHEQKNHTSTFIAGQQSTVYPTAPAGLVFPGDKGIPSGIVSTDTNNFAPRIGFAWSPLKRGQLAIRGGYGIAYDAINGDVVFVGQPFVYTFTIADPVSLSNPMQGQAPLPTAINLKNPQFVGLPSGSFDDRNMRTPYIHQANLGFQYELPKKIVLGMNYVGKFGHKLVLPYTFNPALYAPGATIANQDSRRRIQGFGDLEDFATIESSNYHALQVAVVRRSKTLTVNGSYTWGRSLDTGSAYNAVNTIVQEGGYIPFPFNLKANYGPSDFNATQVMSLSYVMHLPRVIPSASCHFNDNDRITNYVFCHGFKQLFDGWTFSGMYGARTGSPVNPVVGFDEAYSTVPNQPPTILHDWHLSSSRHRIQKMQEWFDRTAFAVPAAGTYGNARRNIIVGPASITNNMGLGKDFPLNSIRKGMNLQFRCDAFGVFNTPNIGNMNSTALQVGSSMGTTYSTYGERRLQLSLHLFY